MNPVSVAREMEWIPQLAQARAENEKRVNFHKGESRCHWQQSEDSVLGRHPETVHGCGGIFIGGEGWGERWKQARNGVWWTALCEPAW